MRLVRLTAAALLVAGTASAQQAPPASSDYALTAANDTLRGQIELRQPLIGKTFVEVDGERRELEEFRELHLDGETIAVVEGRRLAHLVRDGRVRFYSRTTSTPGMMVPNAGPGGGMSLTPGSVSETGYVQVNGGPVLRASATTLRDALGDSPESVRYLDQHRTLGYVQVAATGAGVAAFLGGVLPMIAAEERGETASLNPLVVVGLGSLAVTNFVLPRLRDRARDRAIEAYNR